MINFGKILPETLLDEIGKELSQADDQSLELGQLLNLPSIYIKRLMNVWCERIDKIIELDFNVNLTYTHRSKQALQWRGFTYDEYLDLFNDGISAEDYLHYPVYQFLKLQSPVQRIRFTSQFEADEADYVKVMEENGLESLMDFFLGKYKSLQLTIPVSMMDKHMYIFGGTGSGKSSLIWHMIHRIRDKFHRFSIVLVDPHGDLAERVYHSIQNSDYSKVINFDIDFKKGYTPAINPFEIPDKEPRTLRFAAENIFGTFNEVLQAEGKFSDPQKSMLQKCINYVLTRQDASMDVFLDLLKCKPYVLEGAKKYDEYFAKRFLGKGRADNTREAVLGKFEIFLDNEGLRPVLSGKSTINLEWAMNSGKTVLFNLGGLPDTISKPAFGKILITYIKNIATKRDTKKVVPCMLFIDECQNFVSDTYEVILSQMRKYGVWLVMANQYVNQLGKQVESVQRNTAIKIGSAEGIEDFKGIIKVPKKFLKKTPEDEDKVDLKQFEFLANVRFKGVTKFKPPSFLFTSNKYTLTKEQIEKLDKYQLENYYKVWDSKIIEEQTSQEDVDLEMFDVPED